MSIRDTRPTEPPELDADPVEDYDEGDSFIPDDDPENVEPPEPPPTPRPRTQPVQQHITPAQAMAELFDMKRLTNKAADPTMQKWINETHAAIESAGIKGLSQKKWQQVVSLTQNMNGPADPKRIAAPIISAKDKDGFREWLQAAPVPEITDWIIEEVGKQS